MGDLRITPVRVWKLLCGQPAQKFPRIYPGTPNAGVAQIDRKSLFLLVEIPKRTSGRTAVCAICCLKFRMKVPRTTPRGLGARTIERMDSDPVVASARTVRCRSWSVRIDDPVGKSLVLFGALYHLGMSDVVFLRLIPNGAATVIWLVAGSRSGLPIHEPLRLTRPWHHGIA